MKPLASVVMWPAETVSFRSDSTCRTDQTCCCNAELNSNFKSVDIRLPKDVTSHIQKHANTDDGWKYLKLKVWAICYSLLHLWCNSHTVSNDRMIIRENWDWHETKFITYFMALSHNLLGRKTTKEKKKVRIVSSKVNLNMESSDQKHGRY